MSSLNEQLILEIQRKDAYKVRQIVEQGADVNSVGLEGFTPLLHAARSGNSKIMEILLEHGADSRVKSKMGYTALLLAVDEMNIECIKALDRHGAAMTDIWKGQNVLYLAIVRDHSAIIRYFIDKGIDPLVKNDRGFDAMALANLYSTPGNRIMIEAYYQQKALEKTISMCEDQINLEF